MKSLSLEVLTEINKTLALLTAQVDKLSDLLDKIDSIEGPEKLALYEENELKSAVESEDPTPACIAEESEPVVEEDLPVADSPEKDTELNSVDPATTGAAEMESLEKDAEPDFVELPTTDVAEMDSTEKGAELEPVDLSQDIEVELEGVRLSDVQGFQWMIDIPGSKVSNVISAISLNDRVLLINTLFKENPELFQQTISKFNNMESLSEAISYVLVTFPEWNLNSDVVYRLMMAVRRRLG